MAGLRARSTAPARRGKLRTMSRIPPARYLPFVYDGGRYEVKAGLLPIETDLGNGSADQLVFQRDALGPAYLEAKRSAAQLGAAAPAPLRVIVDEGCRAEVLRHAEGYVRRQLVREQHFTAADLEPWDFGEVVMHLQEDLAIVETVAGGATRLAYSHVSLPSRWSPWTKRGRSFAAVHKPVPGIARIDGDALMTDIVARGHVRVRFVWGLQFDARIDQHPKRGRSTAFDAAAGLWLRVERQVAIGMPAVQAMLFLIHPYVRPVTEVLSDVAAGRALLAAVEGMSDDQLHYKGLRRDRTAIVDFLRARVEPARL